MGTNHIHRHYPSEIRCKRCGSLLAKLERDGLTIHRGGLQLTVDGVFHASVVCYRPTCGALNVINVTPSSSPGRSMS
jgi:hypothetical protein